MSTTQEQIERVRAEADDPADTTQEDATEVEGHLDRTRQFTNTSFSRMRTAWNGDDGRLVMMAEAEADRIVRDRMPTAFGVIERIHHHVRTPLVDGDGVLQTYADGTPMWVKGEFGLPEENWDDL